MEVCGTRLVLALSLRGRVVSWKERGGPPRRGTRLATGGWLAGSSYKGPAPRRRESRVHQLVRAALRWDMAKQPLLRSHRELICL
jgi:hypothetical protein